MSFPKELQQLDVLHTKRHASNTLSTVILIFLMAAVFFSIVFMFLSKAAETQKLSSINARSLKPQIVITKDSQIINATAEQARYSAFKEHSLMLRFDGNLPPNATASISLWVENGHRFTFNNYYLTGKDIGDGTIYGADLTYPCYNNTEVEWSVGIDVSILADGKVYQVPSMELVRGSLKDYQQR